MSFSSSNGQSASRGSASGAASSKSSMVQAWKVRPRVNFLVKGGGIEDDGAEFSIPRDDTLHDVYTDYARFAGVRPSQVRLVWADDYLPPSATPFDRGFKGGEVVLAYGPDLEEPISVNKCSKKKSESIVVVIHDMMDGHSHKCHQVTKSMELVNLYREWDSKRCCDSVDEVTMYFRGIPLDERCHNGATVDGAGLRDGCTIYARVCDLD